MRSINMLHTLLCEQAGIHNTYLENTRSLTRAWQVYLFQEGRDQELLNKAETGTSYMTQMETA